MLMATRAAFTLPGGLLDDDGTRHRRGWLRAIAGADEEWVHGLPASTARAVLVTGLLARCVGKIGGRRLGPRSARRVARALAPGDRDFLMLALFRETFGDQLVLVISCPA